MLETYGQALKRIEKKFDSEDLTGIVRDCGLLVEGIVGRAFQDFHTHLQSIGEKKNFFEFERKQAENPPEKGVPYARFVQMPTMGVAMRFYPQLSKLFPDHPYMDIAVIKNIQVVNTWRNNVSHTPPIEPDDNDAEDVISATEAILDKLSLRNQSEDVTGIPMQHFLVLGAIREKSELNLNEVSSTDSHFKIIIKDAEKLIPQLMQLMLDRRYSKMTIEQKNAYLCRLESSSQSLEIKDYFSIFEETGILEEFTETNLERNIAKVFNSNDKDIGKRLVIAFVGVLNDLSSKLENKKGEGLLDFINMVRMKYLEDNQINERDKIILEELAKQKNLTPEGSIQLIDNVVEAIQKHIQIYQTFTVPQQSESVSATQDSEGILVKNIQQGIPLEMIRTIANTLAFEGDVDALYQKHGANFLAAGKKKEDEAQQKLEEELVELISMGTPLVVLRKMAKRGNYSGDIEALFQSHAPQEEEDEELMVPEEEELSRSTADREGEFLDVIRIAMQGGEISAKMREMMQVKQLELGFSFQRGQELEEQIRNEISLQLAQTQLSEEAQDEEENADADDSEQTVTDLPSPQYLMPYITKALETFGVPSSVENLMQQLAEDIEVDAELLKIEQQGKDGITAFQFRVEWACDTLEQDGKLHRTPDNLFALGVVKTGDGEGLKSQVPSPMKMKIIVLEALKNLEHTVDVFELKKSILSGLEISEKALAFKSEKSNTPVFDERMRWARSALKQDGAVYNPERGKWAAVKLEEQEPTVPQVGMALEIKPETLVSELVDLVQQQLNINIRVYRSTSARGKLANAQDSLEIVAADDVRTVYVDPLKKVGEIEKQFAEQLGLGIQVMNPDEEGFADDDVTLNELADPSFSTGRKSLIQIEMDGEVVSARSVADLYIEVVTELLEKEIDLSSLLPFKIGYTKHLLSVDGMNFNGLPFEKSTKLGGVVINTTPTTRANGIKHIGKLLDALGINWQETDIADETSAVETTTEEDQEEASEEVSDITSTSNTSYLENDFKIVPYRTANFQIELEDRMLHLVPKEEILEWVVAVTNIETPVHMTVVTSRICEMAGIGRAGSRVSEAIKKAASLAKRRGLLQRRGDFLFDKNYSLTIRNRDSFEASEKKFEWISNEELQIALLHQIRLGETLTKNSAARSVFRSLGFGRVTSAMDAVMETVLKQLRRKNIIAETESGELILSGDESGEEVKNEEGRAEPVVNVDGGENGEPVVPETSTEQFASDEPVQPETTSGESIDNLGSSNQTFIDKEYDIIPYEKANFPIELEDRMLHLVPQEEIAEWVLSVAKIEAPVHMTVVTSRICEMAGIGRAGNRVRQAISEAAEIVVSQRQLQSQGDFLFPADGTLSLRNRESFEAQDKDFEWISNEELQIALLHQIRLGETLTKNSAARSVFRSLGFGRVTSAMDAVMETVLKQLRRKNIIAETESGELILSGDETGESDVGAEG